MIKRYYIILILITFFGFLGFIQSAEAGVVWFTGKNISVDFDGLPFNLSNWAPGMRDTKTIKIENDENFDINVYFKADKISEDDMLAEVLTITIGGQSKHLKDLFSDNLSLGTVNAGKLQDYDITISFDSDAGNEYQNEMIDFNFIITVEEIGGNGGGSIPIPGGGGGGVLPQGHIIFNEKEGIVATSSATIGWQTSYFSTSQIIYGTTPNQFDFNAGPEKYGYEFVTTEDINKVSVHSMILTGLIPGTTYYYRCVSHASPAVISQNERSFTTLAMVPAPLSPITPIPAPGPSPESGSLPTPNQSPELNSELTTESGQNVDLITPTPISPIVPDTEIGDIGFGANMLAAIGDIMDSKFLFGISVILLILLVILLIKETRNRYLERKRKKQF